MLRLITQLGSFYAYFGGLTVVASTTVWRALTLTVPTDLKSSRQAAAKTMAQLARMGALALTVNTLCIALIAFASSYSAAEMLSRYGANIFIVDLAVIGLCEHLIPVVTGTVVTGHSGSRVAAELGTMQVTDEITAMRTMALDPVKLLLVPRVFGLTLAMPFLTLTGDVVGLSVSALVGKVFLDLSFQDFWFRMLIVLRFDQYLEIGLAKSVVFGFALAIIACYRGMQVRGGAEAVGRATTASVVDSVIFIILINSVITIIRFT